MSSRWMSRPYQPSPSSPGTSQIELGPRKQPRILFAYHIFPRVTSEAVVPGRHWGTCAWSHTRTSLRRRLLPPMRPFPLSATLLPPPEGWMLRYGAAFGEGLRPFRFDRREQSHFWAWSIPLNYLYRFCFSICFFLWIGLYAYTILLFESNFEWNNFFNIYRKLDSFAHR